MSQDLNTRVEDYRRRIRDQAAEVDRLRGILRDVKAQAEQAGTSRAARAARSAQADLDRADAALAVLKREYARFRLHDGLGQDPAFVDADLLDEELLAMTRGRLARRAADPRSGRVGFDTFRSLLLADLLVGQLIDNEHSDRRADVILDPADERASTKNILRQWVSQAQSDPYVSDALRRASDEASRFSRCLTQFLNGLENLRITYELKQRKSDHLGLVLKDGRVALEASNDWATVERVCPDEVRHLCGAFLGVEEARDELRQLHEELNVELRNLLAAFVPRYITYVSRQSRARRERLGLKRLRSGRLCRYLLDEIERTDFLLPRGSGLEMAVPRIPRTIAAFRKTHAFERFRKSLDRASTVEAK